MSRLSVFFTTCVFMLAGVKLVSQQAVVAGGGSVKAGDGSVSYTVGQVVDGSIKYSGFTIYEGVQQPYEIFIISSTKETDIKISLSPNPALDYVILKTDKILDNMSLRLFAADGKEVLSQPVEEDETTILLENVKGTAYFLVVYADSYQIKSYTIIKQ